MANYADHAYYTNTYKGAVIDAASFDLYARKATQLIKIHTLGHVVETNITDEVKMCCCELAEASYQHETTKDNGNVTSEKVGEYSVSYVDREKLHTAFKSKNVEIINNWLLMTGLLYRGC